MSSPTTGANPAEERNRRLLFDMLAERSLATVTDALREAGIPVAPVKGVVLSRWIYDDVCDRPYVDVDLLVSRAVFSRAVDLVDERGWRVFYRSLEMGELSFTVDWITVELHAEVGRANISRLTVDDVLARARPDAATFPFEILRIDDVDHFLLLVINVVKDGFTYANPHQPSDLEHLLARVAPRKDDLVERTRAAGLMTALHLTAQWMEEVHGSARFGALRRGLPPHGRPLFTAAARLHRRLDQKRSTRLGSPGGLLGLALATLVPDDAGLRRPGLLRVLKRGALRKLGRDPQ